MEFSELVLKRQSDRKYKDEAVCREAIVKCLEAARLAPSACNSQPWKFVVVEDKAALKEMSEAAIGLGMNKFTAGVQVMVAVVQENMNLEAKAGALVKSKDYSMSDLGIDVENFCLQAAEQPSDFYESAVAFGRFQHMLSDFPAHTLFETIPEFHNTINRYRLFKEVLAKDPCGRLAGVKADIDFLLEREELGCTLQRLRESGELPLRVTHNDTKLNNVLLDAKTRKALCVIDLDTVMPGSSLYDYGDSIRFGAATAAEDEQDLSKMELDIHMFRVFTRGLIKACPGLTQKELEYMPLGAKIMTMECGIRFLTDYLDGDNYFAIHRDGHNLDRARTQFKLVADMEAKWDEMQKIVKEEMQ